MKFTESIEELEESIQERENNISNGYIGDIAIYPSEIKDMQECINNMACAVECLKNNES